MASKKTSDTGTAASPRSSEVKLVKRHKEFVEADVEATQAADSASAASGPNPHRVGTALWSAFENRKREAKGLPPTNSINE
jgi:hypothetical protein